LLRDGLADEDWEAWRAMESLHRAVRTRLIGISNVSAAQLAELLAGAAIKPAIVQNRCYASTGWDRDVRAVCAAHGMIYQGFSLLTANRDVLRSVRVAKIAARLRRTVPQVVFRFAQQTRQRLDGAGRDGLARHRAQSARSRGRGHRHPSVARRAGCLTSIA
jgi:diketogulonate reductase-like aldo/keto reductase